MKRALAVVLPFVLIASFATIGAAQGAAVAAAAPPGPGSSYSATGTGQIVNLGVSGAGLDLADVGLATSSATTSSTTSPRSAATSNNLAAAVVGLPLSVFSSGQTAPPDHSAPTVEGLPDVDVNSAVLQLELSALQVSNQARWSGDTSCVSGGLLADSLTTTADASVGVLGTNALSLQAADVRNTNSLVNTASNVGRNKAVRSRAVGTLTDLSLLGQTVLVSVSDDPTLTATATGKAGSAAVTSNAEELVVSVKIGGSAPVELVAGQSLAVPGLGSLTVNAPANVQTAPDGKSASGEWNFLTLNVTALNLSTADIQLLSLTAAATAPTGGLDCAPPAAVSITTPKQNAVVNTTRPVISGTGAEAGATVIVREDGVEICRVTVTTAGAWSCTPTRDLAQGPHTITATQTDTSGVTSPVSPPRTFTVDTNIDAPVITSPPNPSRTRDNTPAVSGTGEAGAIVTVKKRTTTWCTTRVASNNRWSCSAINAQPDGFHLVTATQRDVAGNVSTEAIPRLIVVDTLRPGAPRITSPSPNSAVPAGTVNVRGTGASGGTVTVFDERGTARGTVFVSLNGLWTIPVRGLPRGAHSLTASQIDGARNTSARSTRTVITVTAATTPAVRTPVIDPTLDKQSIATTSLRITGQGQRGSKITVTDERGVRSTAVTVGSSGGWAVQFPASPQGIHRYTATQTATTTTAGRSRTIIVQSQVTQVRLDTTEPPAARLLAPTSVDVQSTTLPVFGGSAEPGVVVEATIDGRFIQPTGGLRGALSDNDRRWILKSTVAVRAGTHTLRLVAVDAAGNRSPALTTTIKTK